MTMTVILDTNVILDAFLNRAPWDEPAKEIIRLAQKKSIRVLVTAKQIADLHYLYKHYLHDEAKAREFLSVFLTASEIIDSKASDCYLAIESPFNDFEDALLAYAARRVKVDYLITRNPKDFCHSAVDILTPTEFLGQNF